MGTDVGKGGGRRGVLVARARYHSAVLGAVVRDSACACKVLRFCCGVKFEST